MKKLILITTFILPAILTFQTRADDFVCPSGYDTSAGGCTKSDTACDGNCTWVYDYKTQSLTYEGTGTIRYSTNTYGIGPIKNLTVGEGITGIVQNTPFTSTFMNIGSSDGKLTLPSTLKSVGGYAMYGLGFGTVEIKSDDVSFSNQSFRFAQGADVNIIMPASNNIKMNDIALYSGNDMATSLHFQCRGGTGEQCGAGIQKALESFKNAGGEVEVGFYEKYEDGKLLEQWGPDGVKNYVYDDAGNLISYSKNGEVLASYTYNSDGSTSIYNKDGNLVGIKGKKIYTVEEAEAVTAHGDKFHVSLTYK